MKKLFILIIMCVCLTSCSNENRIPSKSIIIGEMTNMYYDEYTEIVSIYVSAYKSVNAYYHGHALYYSAKNKNFYYYDNNENKISLTADDIKHE